MSDGMALSRAYQALRAHEREIASLKARLMEADEEIRRLKDALHDASNEIRGYQERARANALIFQGEQANLRRALEYLEKVHDAVKDADEEFNFSGDFDPDGAPDA